MRWRVWEQKYLDRYGGVRRGYVVQAGEEDQLTDGDMPILHVETPK